jgi:hypothetical protein
MASVTEKYIKEAEELVLVEELDNERKLEFLEKQIEGFQMQAYRFLVDVEISKTYLQIGDQGEVPDADKYIQTGQEKIQEAIGHLRSIKVNIEKLCQLRDELKAQE